MAHCQPEPGSKQSPFEGAVGTPGNTSGKAFVTGKTEVYQALYCITGTVPNKYTYYCYPCSAGEAQTGEEARLQGVGQ